MFGDSDGLYWFNGHQCLIMFILITSVWEAHWWYLRWVSQSWRRRLWLQIIGYDCGGMWILCCPIPEVMVMTPELGDPLHLDPFTPRYRYAYTIHGYSWINLGMHQRSISQNFMILSLIFGVLLNWGYQICAEWLTRNNLSKTKRWPESWTLHSAVIDCGRILCGYKLAVSIDAFRLFRHIGMINILDWNKFALVYKLSLRNSENFLVP